MSRLFISFCSLIIVYLQIGCQSEEVVNRYPNGSIKTLHVRHSLFQNLSEKNFHANGIRSELVPLKEGQRNGNYKAWNSKGDISIIGEYLNGKKTGFWRFWIKKNQLEKEGGFNSDQEHGIWKHFYPDGNLRLKVEFDHGDTIATWSTWYDNQNLKEYSSCHSRDTAGVYLRYFKDGKLETEFQCKKHMKTGYYRSYDITGSLRISGSYVNGLKEGEWKWFYPGGEIQKMMSYKIGLRDGPFLFFNLSGDTLANSQFKSGSGRSFFKCPDTPNPICDDTTWVSGLIDDTLIHRNTRQGLELQEQWTLGTKTFQKNYRNGILISQGGFKNQKRHGEWQVWFEHGVLKNKLNYQDGQMLGEQIFYDSTGAIVMSKHHQGPNQKIIVKFGDKIQLNHQQDSQNQAGD